MSKKYIFITFEGVTFQPNSEEIMPDIENLQVVGFANGSDSYDAFKNLINNSEYLKGTAFDEIIGIELLNGQYNYFLINEEKRKYIKSGLNIE